MSNMKCCCISHITIRHPQVTKSCNNACNQNGDFAGRDSILIFSLLDNGFYGATHHWKIEANRVKNNNNNDNNNNIKAEKI